MKPYEIVPEIFTAPVCWQCGKPAFRRLEKNSVTTIFQNHNGQVGAQSGCLHS